LLDNSRTILITGRTGFFGQTIKRETFDHGNQEAQVLSRDAKARNDWRNALGDGRIRESFVGNIFSFTSVGLGSTHIGAPSCL